MGNGVSKEELEKKHVVVIGGGYGGMEAAAELLKLGISFTLIDPKEFFHHNVGALRAMVYHEEWMKQTVISFKETFGDKFLQGRVTNIDFEKKKIFLEGSDEAIEYTDVILAVGSDGPFPGRPKSTTMEAVTEEYLEVSKEIEKANNIVIIGGGPTGVEIAGEIGEKYKMKKLVIIQSNEFLGGAELTPKFQSNLKAGLENINVELHLGERVENLDEISFAECKRQTVKTSKGSNIESDLVLKCTGLRPNTSMTTTIFDPSKFDENNRLKVNHYLQIENLDGVYAIGDCCNKTAQAGAAMAGDHAKLVATNFIREIKGQCLQQYAHKFEGALVPIGPYGGAGVINGWNLPAFIVSLGKGRSLFTSRYWGIMGQKQPI